MYMLSRFRDICLFFYLYMPGISFDSLLMLLGNVRWGETLLRYRYFSSVILNVLTVLVSVVMNPVNYYYSVNLYKIVYPLLHYKINLYIFVK
jgi:hypothetical protein